MSGSVSWTAEVKRTSRYAWVTVFRQWPAEFRSLYTDVGSHYMKALEAAYWRVRLSLCLIMHTVWYSRMGILTLKWVSLALYNRVSQGVSRILSSFQGRREILCWSCKFPHLAPNSRLFSFSILLQKSPAFVLKLLKNRLPTPLVT